MSWPLLLIAVLSGASAVLSLLAFRAQSRARGADPVLVEKLLGLESRLGELTTSLREEARRDREELRAALAASGQALEQRLGGFTEAQTVQFAGLRQEALEGRTKLDEALKASTEAFSQAQSLRLTETNLAMKELAERMEKAQEAARLLQKESMEALGLKIQALTEGNEKKQDAMRETLTANLDQLRKENEAKLEQMRATVEEKLQGTLEARLGESFKLVSERLDKVHQGLGEMQTLASGVGDLKRVLTNVKSRGGWGEVQLGMLLEDLLTKEQFDQNVRIRPDSNEIVEYAVRLPGKEEGIPVFLPIDAKFPQEDYERLLLAQESGVDLDKASTALERAIRAQAKLIADKYIQPPYSTDFAIMYLPTEGLYAEVMRIPGLAQALQRDLRISVSGPSTLSALLTSLQMGFRTLAVEKRSSEVWQVLGAAKKEFQRYGDVWDKLQKQLGTAQNTVDEARRRTAGITRKLRDVEAIDQPGEVLFLADGAEAAGEEE